MKYVFKGLPPKVLDDLIGSLKELNPTDNIIVTVEKRKTLSQLNKLYDLFRLMARETGNNLTVIKNEMKIEHGWFTFYNKNGKDFAVLTSIADMSKEDIALFISQVEETCRDLGYNINPLNLNINDIIKGGGAKRSD